MPLQQPDVLARILVGDPPAEGEHGPVPGDQLPRRDVPDSHQPPALPLHGGDHDGAAAQPLVCGPVRQLALLAAERRRDHDIGNCAAVSNTSPAVGHHPAPAALAGTLAPALDTALSRNNTALGHFVTVYCAYF